MPRCDENGGFCVPNDLCDSGSRDLYCDEENEVCCPYDPLSKTKRPAWPSEVVKCKLRRCEPLYSGMCQSECKDGRSPVGKCTEECVCCGCPATDECLENSGYCIPSFDTCIGTTIQELCAGENCTCCLPPELIIGGCPGILPPKECLFDYDGVCQKECEEGRIPTGFCGTACQCCGCPITDECKAYLGYCTTKSDTCDGASIPELCSGENCTCCLPEDTKNDTVPFSLHSRRGMQEMNGYCFRGPDATCEGMIFPDLCPEENCACCLSDCPVTEECEAYNGRCRKTCAEGEEPIPEILCPDSFSDSCVCCVPICNQTQECQEAYGYCTNRALCYEKVIPEWCDGEDCVCCTPVCPPTQECQDAYGYCTGPDNCYDKIVPEWCDGEDCVCCAPVCPPTQECQDAYGYCTSPDNCYEKIVPEWCDGEDCVCCAPVCPPTQECQDAYGYCTSPDNCYEKIVPEWCDGEDCVCCAPVCPPTQECQDVYGYCTSPDNCYEKIVPEWCDGDDCVCCAPVCPATPTQECQDAYGYCTSPDNCYEKIVPEWCDGEDCVCCAPVCPPTQACQDVYGYCTSPDNCYEKIVPEWCDGEDCVCCAPGKLIQHPVCVDLSWTILFL
ncbi:keratin-associated protein 10-7-like [Macrobrachium rosenbergii]|uniref:keratin-associated protein 10-7-like n=1 Tax=Macrobrachium rosenbergii TaxID=79674 RepID=UPI0034D70600